MICGSFLQNYWNYEFYCKIKKILTYFCTGERDWQKMIKWTSDNDLWKKWDAEYKEKLAKKRRLEVLTDLGLGGKAWG